MEKIIESITEAISGTRSAEDDGIYMDVCQEMPVKLSEPEVYESMESKPVVPASDLTWAGILNILNL